MTKALWSLLPIPPSWHWGCFLSKNYKTNYKRLKQECPLFCFLQQESWRTWGQSWGLACVYEGPWLFLNVSDVPPCWAVGVRLCGSRGYIPIFRWAFVFHQGKTHCQNSKDEKEFPWIQFKRQIYHFWLLCCKSWFFKQG